MDQQFDLDYKFILDYREYTPGRNYLEDRNRFLLIINRYENYPVKEGKHYWLIANAYYYLQRKEYRQGVILNLEKYLDEKPFDEDYKNNKIIIDFDYNFVKKPETKKELELAKKIHFQMVYYLLAKTCQQENLLQKAYEYIDMGIKIYPENKMLYFWELYEVLRKMNNLQEFINCCEKLTVTEKQKMEILIKRAHDLIDKGYIFKPR